MVPWGFPFSGGHAALNRMSSKLRDKITKVSHERGTLPGLESQALKTSLPSEKDEEVLLGGLGKLAGASLRVGAQCGLIQ